MKSRALEPLLIGVVSLLLTAGPSVSLGAPENPAKPARKDRPVAKSKADTAKTPAPESEGVSPTAPSAGSLPPEYADAWPSEYRPAPGDLALLPEGERKAQALVAFAQGLLAEDSADSDAALEAFKKAVQLDPTYGELAVQVAFELAAKRDQVTEAIQILKDSIKASPADPRPLVYLSEIYARFLKKPDLALKYAEQAVAAGPAHLAAHRTVFELHLAAGDVKKAEATLERAAKTAPADGKYWRQLGELHVKLHIKDDAQSEPALLDKVAVVFRKAAELSPKDAAVQAAVGDFFARTRQAEKAMPFYETALALPRPDGDDSLDNLREKLGRAYLAVQRLDDGIAQFERLAREQPRRLDAYEMLGELYEMRGRAHRERGELEKAEADFDRSTAQFEHSLLIDSSRVENYVRLWAMLMKNKRFDKAVETMREARAKFRNQPFIAYRLALALRGGKKDTDALAVFAEAKAEAELYDRELLTGDFFFEYGIAAERAGLLDRAAELFRRSIEIEPESPNAYNYLGYTWVDKGINLDEAGELIKKAVSLAPDSGAYIDSLGWWHFKKGNFEQALKELLRAADLSKRDPDMGEDATVNDHIADAYAALGKTAEALQDWQKALAIEKEDRKLIESISAKAEAAKKKLDSAKAEPAASPGARVPAQ